MRLVIKVNLDNAAFEGEGGPAEAAEILRKAAAGLESETTDFAHLSGMVIRLKDSNGNRVGSLTVED